MYYTLSTSILNMNQSGGSKQDPDPPECSGGNHYQAFLHNKKGTFSKVTSIPGNKSSEVR